MKFKIKLVLYFQIFFIIFFSLLIMFYYFKYPEIAGRQTEVIREGSRFFAEVSSSGLIKDEEVAIVDSKSYEIELMVFEEINLVRTQAGLTKLEWDPKLAQIAREHSLEMAKFSYLNHTGLDGKGPNERAKDLGLKLVFETEDKVYTGIGENIGFMPKGINDVGIILTSEDIASGMVYKWMLSPPHKDNILGEYFFTGIGVAYDEFNNFYLTQEFQ